jgi:thymidylate synthase
MHQYQTDLAKILIHGETRTDRTGVGTKSIFGLRTEHKLKAGFPAVTTKKLAWRAMLTELLWFIEGSGDDNRLKELLHGDKHTSKGTIWSANANAPYWASKARFQGDLGRIYGVQWRSWSSYRAQDTLSSVDQLTALIQGLKNDPHGRRHIITAWNPGELDQMALPPCHCFAQFYVNNNNELSCQMYQRSADFLLGIPFNIASYALFTHMIAQVCGMGVDRFIHINGDAHLYLNHINQVKEILSRTPLQAPILKLNPLITEIDKFTEADIQLVNYNHHPPINAPMAV